MEKSYEDLIRQNELLKQQAQRDFGLAAEWKAKYEAAQANTVVLQTRLHKTEEALVCLTGVTVG